MFRVLGIYNFGLILKMWLLKWFANKNTFQYKKWTHLMLSRLGLGLEFSLELFKKLQLRIGYATIEILEKDYAIIYIRASWR